jgi:hypothetical protein
MGDGRSSTVSPLFGARAGSSAVAALGAAAREVWRNLPVWFVYVGSLSLHHVAVAMIDPASYAAAGFRTAAFSLAALAPAAWIVAYVASRVALSRSALSGMRWRWALPALVLAPYIVDGAVMAIAPSLRTPTSQSALRFQFEYYQFLWFSILAVHALVTRGARALAAFFAVGLIYGAVLENTGIVLGFFSEPRFDNYLPPLPAPIATMLGWSMIAYCGIWTAEQFGRLIPPFGRTPLRLAIVATAMALSVDLQTDPLASLYGLCWQWNSLLPTWFLSVPFCNFAAWLGAYLPFAWAYFSLEGRTDLTGAARNWRLLARVPVLAVTGGLIWLALMTVHERSTAGPTYQILGAFFARVLPPRL